MVKQIVFECKKILHVRTISMLLGSLLMIYFIYYAVQIYSPNVGSAYTPGAYRELTNSIDANSISKEYENLSAVYNSMLFEGNEPDKMFTTSYRQEFMLYEQVLKEMAQVDGYKEYLNNVKDNARKSTISIFEANQASQRNSAKTSADFEKMGNTTVKFLGSYGINEFLKTDVWDFLMIAAIFILVASLVTVEIEENKISLLRCTKNGRGKTAYAKLFTGIFLLVLLQIIVYGYRFIIVAATYGLPDLTSSFQSVYGSESCTLILSILEALVLFLGLKLFVTIALFSFIFLISLLIRNSWKLYVIGFSVVAVSWILYERIDINSFLSGLKWLNPVAFLHTDSLIMVYRNLMIFGYPISYLSIVTILCVLVFVMCTYLAVFLYKRILPDKGHAFSNRFSYVIEATVSKLTGRYSLAGYELRKWSFYQKGIFVCALLVVIAIVAYEPVSERLFTKQEIYYKYYVNQVKGTYSREKMDYLYEQKEYLEGIKKKLEAYGIEFAESVIRYYNDELDKGDGLLAVIQYGDYLEEVGGEEFIYEQGYEMLFGRGEGSFALLLCRTLSLASMVILAVFIWNIEDTSKMKYLIRISYIGEKKINRRKYLNVMLAGTIVFAIIYIPWIYNVFSVFGHGGVFASANSLKMFHQIPSYVMVVMMLLLFYLAHLLYLWLVGCCVRFLYRKINNIMATSVVAFGIGMIPVMLLSI